MGRLLASPPVLNQRSTHKSDAYPFPRSGSRDNIRTWLVGRVQEDTALAKMRPMLAECRADIESRLPTQETGQFHLLRDGAVVGLLGERNALPPIQLPEDRILTLAGRSSPG
jgi:hypothetical protein